MRLIILFCILMQIIPLEVFSQSEHIESLDKENIIGFEFQLDNDESKKVSIDLKGMLGIQYNYINPLDNREYLVGYDENKSEGTRYFLQPNNRKPKYNSNFAIRRARIGMDIKMPYDIYMHIMFALDLGQNQTSYGVNRDYIDYGYFGKKFDHGLLEGRLELGYRKVYFGVEEHTPPFKIKNIERSIANNYFNQATNWTEEGRPPGYVCTPLGIGNRHTGLYWDGKLNKALQGLKYYLAITSEAFDPFRKSRGSEVSRMYYYFGLGYDNSWENKSLNFGLNYALIPQGVAYFPIEEQRYSRLSALNPYLEAKWDGLRVFGEAFFGEASKGQFIDGGFTDNQAPDRALNAPTAYSTGYTIIASYLTRSGIEPVLRYSNLDTGGAGFSSGFIRDIIPNEPSRLETSNFNKAHQLNATVNYQVIENHLRFSVGYEYIQLKENIDYKIFINNNDTQVPNSEAQQLIDDSKYEMHIVRARMQFYF
ncbi:porin [Aureibacter tunicatorum]|uniref:Porin n=1 Tax=Aureibacter tunicatorum TaxID=866807 RepID=A0AAE3XLT6_9BACT|nr:porin [Aureibacter tunicatorum]MDR6238334.1 hypothetical protein [Aureibacter tunicatorum]BDD03366.1 hypothetical protein AUTU_08490 [Aureibacter tunicatorum]